MKRIFVFAAFENNGPGLKPSVSTCCVCTVVHSGERAERGLLTLGFVTDAKGQVVKLVIINVGTLQSIENSADRLPKQIHSHGGCCERPALLSLQYKLCGAMGEWERGNPFDPENLRPLE